MATQTMERRRVIFKLDEDELARLREHDERYNSNYGTIFITLAGAESFIDLLTHLKIQIVNQS
ncbi:hypothetical protein KA017_01075 [Candidatus Woesebacteria bacterium]|nr:hypothetical protein [Candidatus Woesebacteria bacterium]